MIFSFFSFSGMPSKFWIQHVKYYIPFRIGYRKNCITQYIFVPFIPLYKMVLLLYITLKRCSFVSCYTMVLFLYPNIQKCCHRNSVVYTLKKKHNCKITFDIHQIKQLTKHPSMCPHKQKASNLIIGYSITFLLTDLQLL